MTTLFYLNYDDRLRPFPDVRSQHEQNFSQENPVVGSA